MNQDHLIVCVHESVPRALKSIGMHEVAKLLKTQNLEQPEDWERVQAILDSIGPKLAEAKARCLSMLKGASPEMALEAQKYQGGLSDAYYAVLAAKQTTKLVAQGKLTLN